MRKLNWLYRVHLPFSTNPRRSLSLCEPCTLSLLVLQTCLSPGPSHTDKCSSKHCSIQEIKAPALLLQFAVPLLVGCCGIKRSRLIYPWEMEAQTDGREHKPSRAINHSRAAPPALLCGCAGHRAPSGINAPALSCVRVPFPGEGTHPAPQACCTPALSWLCSLPGTAPSSDQETKLQAQQASQFLSLLSHIQGNVSPLGSFLEKGEAHSLLG